MMYIGVKLRNIVKVSNLSVQSNQVLRGKNVLRVYGQCKHRTVSPQAHDENFGLRGKFPAIGD